MLKRIWENKGYVICIAILTFITSAISSYLYIWLDKMYRYVKVGTTRQEILYLILIGVLIWLSRRPLGYAATVMKSRAMCNIKYRIKEDIFTNAICMNEADLASRGASGEYISLFTNDLNILEQRYFGMVMSFITNTISIVVMGSAFMTLNPVLAVLTVVFGLSAGFIPLIFGKRLNRENLTYSNNLARFTARLKEWFQGYATVKNYAVEDYILKKFTQENTKVEDSKFKYDCYLGIANEVGGLLSWYVRIIIIGAGLVMISRGEIELGTLVAAQGFASELAVPLDGLLQNINSMRSVKSIARKMEDLSTEAEPRVCKVTEPDSAIPALRYEDVTLTIKGREIVKDFTYTFEPGKKYLIIGRNGSGKSSIMKILQNRFTTYSGDVYVGKNNVKEIGTKAMSGSITYLNERVSLFSDTVSNNIKLGRAVSPQGYVKALRDAQITLDEAKELTEDGYNLSSGEQRRLELARCLLSSSKVIVFDEVVSTMDIETAYEVEKEALSWNDRTLIFISHNFSGKLVKEYDEILIMKDGRLDSHGSYETLMAESEYFRNICSIKFGK